MSNSKSPEKNYILDISQYSIDDLFGLFDLPQNTRDIRIEHVKLAKHKVMQSHPDKSRLPPEYFIFYKEAFERIVQIYESQHKTEQTVPIVSCKSQEMKYSPISENPCISSKRFHQMQTQQNQHLEQEKTKTKDFNNNFNRLFEENMWEKPDTSKNEWFQQKTNPYAGIYVESVSQMNTTLEKIKGQEKQRALAVYRGVQPLFSTSSRSGGANFYEDDNSSDQNGIDDYISSDIFGKLKYDDLRKVHKDQTVFMVSDSDMINVKTYDSVDQYKDTRNNIRPMEKTEAEQIFLNKQKIDQERTMQRDHLAHLKSLEYAEKNKKVMSSFLQLN